jgi:hypothetical protein
MRLLTFRSLLFLASAAMLTAADPYCPAYPAAVRTEIEQSMALDRAYHAYSKAAAGRRTAVNLGALADSGNIIDQAIARKMAADSVEPAPRTTDTEFLRRIYLDLCRVGRRTFTTGPSQNRA